MEPDVCRLKKVQYPILGLILAALSVLCVGCTSSTSPVNNSEDETSQHCTEPENPYEEGTGHYAGYEWAQTNNPGPCGGGSQSFIEGCEDYESQESQYEECEAKKRK
jgi:hypothetical protein